MPIATRTLHPLPFEHLEPKRFEDLVRQLAYDFRRWRQLEATGRAGSDDGFDARGFEIVGGETPLPVSGEEAEEGLPEPESADRQWLIQCKREKEIGPKKLLKHLNAIPTTSIDGLHGLVLVAACDFSKAAIDAFREWCIQRDLQEFYLWGRAAVEDLLYQPKNDHLLFAYFGVSLQIRRQKVASNIRRTVSLKRRLQKHVAGGRTPVVLRDPTDDRYPFTEDQSLVSGKFLWLPCEALGVGVFGLMILGREHFAYYDPEREQWDLASRLNRAIPRSHDNPWYDAQATEPEDLPRELYEFWNKLPSRRGCSLTIVQTIPYDEIIEIDDVGDDLLKVPTIFARFREGRPPYLLNSKPEFTLDHGGFIPVPPEGHVRVFPERFRDESWETGWFGRNNAAYSKAPFSIPDDEETPGAGA